MAEYRTIKMSFWNDPYIESLSCNEKLLYIYFFTSPHTNNLGLLEISIKKISFETSLDINEIYKIIQKFQDDNKLFYDVQTNEILMKNFIKNQCVTSELIIKGLLKLCKNVQSKQILYILCNTYENIFCDIDPPYIPLEAPYIPLLKEEEEVKEEYKVKEEEEEKDKNEDILSLVNFFINQTEVVHGSLAPKKTKTLVNNSYDVIDKLVRIDKFELEDIRVVIEWAMNNDFWKDKILSLAGLRKRNNSGIMKFQNIKIQHDKEKNNTNTNNKEWWAK